VGLVVGKRATSPTVPMILAARMGPMPKISVRVVPEAATSASMRPLRPAIFLSSVRILSAAPQRSQPRRRRRAEAPPLLGRRPRKMHAARSAESVRATPPAGEWALATLGLGSGGGRAQGRSGSCAR
jgi:hypothetical protein